MAVIASNAQRGTHPLPSLGVAITTHVPTAAARVLILLVFAYQIHRGRIRLFKQPAKQPCNNIAKTLIGQQLVVLVLG
jgi:hypothetical protein